MTFAAPLLTFLRCRPGLQGLPAHDAPHCSIEQRGVPRDLRLIFRAPVGTRGASRPVTRNLGTCLSWDSLEPVCPSSDITRLRPRSGPTSPPFLDHPCHQMMRAARVVSHHLDGLFRTRAPGLVASRSQKGFATFRSPACRLPPSHPKTTGRHPPDQTRSRSAVHTPRRSPPAGSRAMFPPPLPPRRCASATSAAQVSIVATTLDLGALLHRRVQGSRPRCRLSRPSPSMGFVPLQGSGRSRRLSRLERLRSRSGHLDRRHTDHVAVTEARPPRRPPRARFPWSPDCACPSCRLHRFGV